MHEEGVGDELVDAELESIALTIDGGEMDVDFYDANLADWLTADVGDVYHVPISCTIFTDGHAYPTFGDECNNGSFWTGTAIIQTQSPRKRRVMWYSMVHFKPSQTSV